MRNIVSVSILLLIALLVLIAGETAGRLPQPEKPEKEGAPALVGGVLMFATGDSISPDGTVEIDGLPGFPLRIESVHPRSVAVAEAPGPQTGWRTMVLRVRPDRDIIVTVTWTRIQ